MLPGPASLVIRIFVRIVMIGAGYVGLVSGACFADFGHYVISVDNDVTKIATLKQCQIPIYEPDPEQLVREGMAAGRLKFETDLDNVTKADAIFIAVGTPSRPGDGHADLSYANAAAKQIAPYLKDFTAIITKSTVPVGTGDELEPIVREVNPEADFAVASNPEFLREGAAIRDFKLPDPSSSAPKTSAPGKCSAISIGRSILTKRLLCTRPGALPS